MSDQNKSPLKQMEQYSDFYTFASQSINILLNLDNIGPQKIKALKQNNINTIWQLLISAPKKIITIDDSVLISDNIEKYITIKATLLKCIKQTGKISFIITFKDLSNKEGKILFFTKKLPFNFEINKQVILSGTCKNNTLIHPKILPINCSNILHQYFFKAPLFDSTIGYMIKHCINNPICMQKCYKTDKEYINWNTLFTNLHFGTKQENIQATNILKQLEAFSYKYILSKQHKKICIESMFGINNDYQALYNNLMQTLTICQTNAMAEIEKDFQGNMPSQRMIFGDVGTGKTRVMILSSLHALSKDKKVLFLAPTKLLAEQVYTVFSNTLNFNNTNTNIKLLSQTTSKKITIDSNTQIIIGTHALIQEKYTFNNVGLIIIDEQHKFGVMQRNALINKEPNAHHICLSATPIPRSLMMVMQNYLKVSTLKYKPKPITINTYLIENTLTEELLYKIKQNLKSNELLYWICPAINDEEDELGYMNAQDRFNQLTEIFHDKVGLIHGKMNKNEQEKIYQAAINKQIQILVSTTVVEVGIDIPHANIIIIEDANRFGLAQLHQLRGRVGRNGQDGKCILIYPKKISENGKLRLQAMKSTSDGFELAEQDMKIRGHGIIFGNAQTGFYDFKFLSLPFDTELLNFDINNACEIDKISKLFFAYEAMKSM